MENVRNEVVRMDAYSAVTKLQSLYPVDYNCREGRLCSGCWYKEYLNDWDTPDGKYEALKYKRPVTPYVRQFDNDLVVDAVTAKIIASWKLGDLAVQPLSGYFCNWKGYVCQPSYPRLSELCLTRNYEEKLQKWLQEVPEKLSRARVWPGYLTRDKIVFDDGRFLIDVGWSPLVDVVGRRIRTSMPLSISVGNDEKYTLAKNGVVADYPRVIAF